MKTTGKTYSIMGILNVTPDSFYDGGKFCDVEAAVLHAAELYSAGADSIDVGGASSRPGAVQLSEREECERVLPVVKKLLQTCPLPLSVDTTSSVVAKKVLEAGAAWINDISAGRSDSDMVKVVADYRCKVVLMHSRGTPQTMMEYTGYTSLVHDVVNELRSSVDLFIRGGVAVEQILIDPGIGFAKTSAQNIELLGCIEDIVAMGFPVVLGTSRKSFIGMLTGKNPEERLCGTLGSIAHACLKGVTTFRVHDVGATKDFLNVLTAIG